MLPPLSGSTNYDSLSPLAKELCVLQSELPQPDSVSNIIYVYIVSTSTPLAMKTLIEFKAHHFYRVVFIERSFKNAISHDTISA